LFAKLLVTFIMLVGLVCTTSVALSGTLIILLGAVLYGAVTGFLTFAPWTSAILLTLVITAEFGGRVLRTYLTRKNLVSCSFSVNGMISYVAGLLACNALLGSSIGLICWHLIAGKALMPRGDHVVQVLFHLSTVAALRFVCGIIMILLINIYIFM